MSYSKHNFAAGQILTASDLNEMDDQIALNEQNSQSTGAVTNGSISGNVITFKTSSGTTAFTITLPVYSGG